MAKYIILILLGALTSCVSHNDQNKAASSAEVNTVTDTTYQWVKILDSAEWRKSYNFQMFTVNDTMWVFHQDGNWFSADGKNWTKSVLPNAINNLAFLKNIYFHNAIYGLGHFQGNSENYTFLPVIYQSKDLKHWVTLAEKSNLPPRFFYSPFVFDNKIWFIGGDDVKIKYADIWNSTDGIYWVKQKDDLPFEKGGGRQVVEFNNKLFLLGNDVWSSTDALNWQLETAEIVKGEKVFGYAPVVFDNKIWLLGCNRNGQFSSQVFVSKDGKNWEGQKAPWSPRGGIAATVYKGKIYMTGGKYGGTSGEPDFRYSNDVWALEKK